MFSNRCQARCSMRGGGGGGGPQPQPTPSAARPCVLCRLEAPPRGGGGAAPWASGASRTASLWPVCMRAGLSAWVRPATRAPPRTLLRLELTGLLRSFGVQSHALVRDRVGPTCPQAALQKAVRQCACVRDLVPRSTCRWPCAQGPRVRPPTRAASRRHASCRLGRSDGGGRGPCRARKRSGGPWLPPWCPHAPPARRRPPGLIVRHNSVRG